MRFTEGDVVRVKPRPGHRDGFTAKVVSVKEVDGCHEVTVIGGSNGRKAFRTFTPDRLVKKRVRQ